MPWLEPDVNDHLTALAKGRSPRRPAASAPSAVVVPVGFVSDHMEVVHDLDVEAAETAASLGLPFARAKAPGPTPRFAQMVSELVAERLLGAQPLALGGFGPRAYPRGRGAVPPTAAATTRRGHARPDRRRRHSGNFDICH